MSYKRPFYRAADGYDWEKTLKHFLYGLVLTVLAAGLTWSISYVQLAELPPEYAIYTGLIISILSGISNMVKHWKDEYEEGIN